MTSLRRCFLLPLALSLLLLACGDASSGGASSATEAPLDEAALPAVLKPYWEQLPKEESVNASLYAYELILARLKAAFQAGDYLAVFTNYHFYQERFFEAEVTDESALHYYFGKSLLSFFRTAPPPVQARGLAYLKKNRSYFSLHNNFISPRANQAKPRPFPLVVRSNFRYYGAAFETILFERQNYFFEKLALSEIAFQKFTLPARTKSHTLANLDQLHWLVARYPDLPYVYVYRSVAGSTAALSRAPRRLTYRQLLQNSSFLNPQFLSSKKARQQVQNITNILSTLKPNQQARQQALIIELFSQLFAAPEAARPHRFERLLEGLTRPPAVGWERTLVVRTRADELASRNLTRLQGWEPFWRLYETPGERTGRWARIVYRGRETGFVRLDETPLFPVNNYSYLLAAKHYYDQDYLSALETLAALLNEMDKMDEAQPATAAARRLREMSYLLFYKSLDAIAQRSTSQANPYTRFVMRFPGFFSLQTNLLSPPSLSSSPLSLSAPPSLTVSQQFFPRLFQSNFTSPMLQYY